MTKFQKESGKGDEAGGKSAFSRGFCSVLNFVTALTRDLLVGPPTDLQNCLSAFFDTSVLKGKYTALLLSNPCENVDWEGNTSLYQFKPFLFTLCLQGICFCCMCIVLGL